MTEKITAGPEGIIGMLNDLFARPLWEIILLTSVMCILVVATGSTLFYIASKVKGGFSFNLFNILKFGKKEKKEEEEGKKDIVINIHNEVNKEEEDIERSREIEKTNDLLQEISQDGIDDAKRKFDALPPLDKNNTNDNDLLLVVSKSVRFGAEISKFKEIVLIKDQMTAAEARMDLIEGMIIRDYMEMVYKIKGRSTNVQEDQSYRIFSEIIHNQTHKIMLILLRRMFKDNHLTGFEEEAYSDYIDTQCERLITGLRLSINSSMPSFLDPGREAVNDLIDKKTRMIQDTLQDVFIEARGMAHKVELIVKKKEREFDDEIRHLTGITNAYRRTGVDFSDPYNLGQVMKAVR